jgi:hypothetical protein
MQLNCQKMYALRQAKSTEKILIKEGYEADIEIQLDQALFYGRKERAELAGVP